MMSSQPRCSTTVISPFRQPWVISANISQSNAIRAITRWNCLLSHCLSVDRPSASCASAIASNRALWL